MTSIAEFVMNKSAGKQPSLWGTRKLPSFSQGPPRSMRYIEDQAPGKTREVAPGPFVPGGQPGSSIVDFMKNKVMPTATGLFIVGKGVQAVTNWALKGKRQDRAFNAVLDYGKKYEGVSYNSSEKAHARKYFDSIAKHSPTVAADPIAAFNTVQHFVRSPGMLTSSSVEQLYGVEAKKMESASSPALREISRTIKDMVPGL